MKIKLSQYTQRKIENTFITQKVSILSRKVTQKNQTEIYLNLDALLVMREDTMPEIVLGKKKIHKKKGNKRRHHAHAIEDMNLPQRESNTKVTILQLMKNMF